MPSATPGTGMQIEFYGPTAVALISSNPFEICAMLENIVIASENRMDTKYIFGTNVYALSKICN
jgi:hypothetical protein